MAKTRKPKYVPSRKERKEKIAQIAKEYEEGTKYKDICKMFDIPTSTLYNYLNQAFNDPDHPLARRNRGWGQATTT